MDNNDDNDLIYYNLKNEARFDLKAVINTKKDDYELESEINLKVEDKVSIAKHTNCCQIRSDIYSLITIILSNRYEYFKCKTCTQ